MRISYHISHEQFAPRELLGLVRQAESAGFDAAFSSDHINPWTPIQGHSGHLWAWLGAALQATSRLSFACITVPGGWRYHPTVVAQAVATLGEMFPGRLPWIALGSGEALNECVIGQGWPEASERNARLQEGAEIIRDLLRGECVTRSGHLRVVDARIWSRPERSTLLMGAALSATTAEWVGTWADGLLTVGSDLEKLSGIVAAFRRTAPAKPIHVKVDLSWAPTDSQALQQAHEQWRVQRLPARLLHDLRTPEQFEEAARSVRAEEMPASTLVSADLEQHVSWLRDRAALGLASLDVHNVGLNQGEFIEAFGRHVLPKLRD
jgi:probable non-F420 flavinoid oxidoreductase